MNKFLILHLLILSSSCVTTQAEEPVRKKAAFDLSCPKDKLHLTTLDEDNVSGAISYGVSGCGQKVSYHCQRKIIGSAVCIKESETTKD